MSKNAKELDKSKPFGQVRGHPVRRYSQEGCYFDHFGKYCGTRPGYDEPKKEAPAPKKKVSPAERKAAALAAAAEKLQSAAKPLPDPAAEAAKENAQALAAEDSA